MKTIILLLGIFIGSNFYSQNLTCDDFKLGTFYIKSDEIVKKEFVVIRKENSQIEYTKSKRKEKLSPVRPKL